MNLAGPCDNLVEYFHKVNPFKQKGLRSFFRPCGDFKEKVVGKSFKSIPELSKKAWEPQRKNEPTKSLDVKRGGREVFEYTENEIRRYV